MIKKRNLLRFIASTLALNMLTCTATAETQVVNYDSTQDDTPAVVQQVLVDAERAEVYSVTLPKSITLDGSQEQPSYTYTVQVNGEISSSNFVRVIPLDGSYIQTEQGTTYDLTVQQEKRRWTNTEVATGDETTGLMSVAELNPGKYTGIATFLISLDDGYFYDAATCTTSKMRVAEDINDNGVVDTGEELAVPEALGVPLGHTCEGEHQFEYECARCHNTIYEVSTPMELFTFTAMATSGNTFENIEIDLIADIDLTELCQQTPFYPIGANVPFEGTFDGNNYSISGLNKGFAYCKPSEFLYSGLFGLVGNATIKNLVFKDSTVKIDTTMATDDGYINYYGSLVGCAVGDVTIENCRIHNVNADIKYARGVSNNGIIGQDAYNSPFVGISLNGAANVIIRNSCAVGNTYVVDASTHFTGVTNNTTRFGYLEGTTNLIVESSYVVDTLSNLISTETSSINNDIVHYLGSDVTTTYTNLPYAVVGTNCTELTNEELKSQTGVDLLNTGYDVNVWQMDLLNVNNEYPVQVA